MILIALGANLPSAIHGTPRQTLEAALVALAASGVCVLARSRWYETAPVPVSDQPWYVNGVASVATELSPIALLALLHDVECRFGRVRGAVNEARLVDLDIVDYEGRVEVGPPILPHPRAHERGFVLLPLADVAPRWHHPATGLGVAELLAALPPGQDIRVLPA
ncbi:MAG TPA: 2-amino-4-hydroxy-6-hydroxymethyldihydropteridine diphosphokinase [Stellaceae bacterium]|nr:2-amino-4-hydroxy-6-hydroxymethyldihydropteridine diphosphokinase [Stellaceae bacterium]